MVLLIRGLAPIGGLFALSLFLLLSTGGDSCTTGCSGSSMAGFWSRSGEVATAKAAAILGQRERGRRERQEAVLGKPSGGAPGGDAATATAELGPSKRLQVVASIAPLADFVRRVGGPRVRTTLLVGLGRDPHMFALRPSQVAALYRADLIVLVGSGFEFWAQEVLPPGMASQAKPSDTHQVGASGEASSSVSSPSVARLVLRVGENLPSLPPAAPTVTTATVTTASESGLAIPVAGHHADHHAAGHDASHDANPIADHPADYARDHADHAGTPHPWLDPLAARVMVNRITEALTRVDPAGGPGYHARATAANAELTALHEEFAAALSPLAGRMLVTVHPGYEVLARRYGLRTMAILPKGHGGEPSAAHLGELVRYLKKSTTRAILAEAQLSPHIAEIIAKETAVDIATLDPLGSLTGGDYLAAMQANLRAIVYALR